MEIIPGSVVRVKSLPFNVKFGEFDTGVVMRKDLLTGMLVVNMDSPAVDYAMMVPVPEINTWKNNLELV